MLCEADGAPKDLELRPRGILGAPNGGKVAAGMAVEKRNCEVDGASEREGSQKPVTKEVGIMPKMTKNVGFTLAVTGDVAVGVSVLNDEEDMNL